MQKGQKCGVKEVGTGHHILWIVEGTALTALQIFVDCGLAEEELEEWMKGVVDDIVDAGHRINDGENFDFDQNDYD